MALELDGLPDHDGEQLGTSSDCSAGLTCWTFYIPYRILRQLGVGQAIPLVDLENFVMPNFNHATIQAYQRTWRERVTVPRDQNPNIVLSGRYKRWLAQEIEARKNGNQI